MGLLLQKARGAYGSELVHMSDGKLKRNSVYSLLGRLEKSGFVKATDEAPSAEYALPRTVYRITGQGTRAHAEFADFVGLAVPGKVAGVA